MLRSIHRPPWHNCYSFIWFCSCAHLYWFSNKSRFVLNVTCFSRFPHFCPTVFILNNLHGVIKSWPTLLTLILTLLLQHRMANNVNLVTKSNNRAKILGSSVRLLGTLLQTKKIKQEHDDHFRQPILIYINILIIIITFTMIKLLIIVLFIFCPTYLVIYNL